MRINHNIAALNTYRQLSSNAASSQKSLEKLSSGLRINRAGDDAAGLAISEKMRGQIRGLDQASRNAQDGISMIQTSEGALAETQSILQRMKELATQSANGTNTDSDRNEIQKEMNQLSTEINRIGNTTEFNTQKLLKGKTAPVVETAATVGTTTTGEAGVAVGATSELAIDAKSVKSVSSTATVQASTSAATGSIDTFSISTNSTAGVKATVSLANGLNFVAAAGGTGSNNKTITIEQQTAGTTTTSITNSGNTWTIKIGTNSDGSSVVSNRGELYNTITGSTDYATFKSSFTLDTPTNTSEVVSDVAATGTTAGGVAEVLGKYTFKMANAFEEAGDTVKIGGKTFTAVIGTADLTKGEFSIGATADAISDLDTQAASLLATIVDASQLGGRFDDSAGAAVTAYDNVTNTFTLQEAAAKATGVDLAAPVVAGSGTDDKLSITDASGRNLKTITIKQTSASAVAAVSTTNAYDSFTVSSGNNTVALNGVTIAFNSGLTANAAATALTSVWNSATKTLTIDGNINSGDAENAQSASLLSEIQSGLTTAGYDVGTMTSGASLGTAVAAGNLAALKAATLTFAGGVQTTASTQRTYGFSMESGASGTSLNGVKVAFSSITSGAPATALTSTWDDATQTLTVTGTLNNAAAVAVQSTSLKNAIQSGLTSAGFSVGTMTNTDLTGALANQAAIDANLNDTSITFGNGSTVTAADTLAVDQNDGDITIYLAETTASKNTAAKIQSAIQALGDVGGYDFSKYTVTSSGNWDTKTFGNSIIDSSSTLVGGTQEVKGTYNLDVTKAFAVGDKVEIKGQVFTAVASGAKASDGEFDVGSGNIAAQTLSLRDSISLNDTIKDAYSVSGSGSNITLTEKVGSGVDLQSSDLAVRATGTQGEYTVAAPELLTSGAKFVLDGQEISVSSKNEHIGYANGTAIKEAASVADQTKALADAINTNANLKDKYTASVGTDGSLTLKQTEDFTTDTAPVVSTKSSAEGDFTSTFQVGANSGQSMTIEVADMRSKALGITGDGTASTVKASNGFTAFYVSTANVTDGTTNTNVEYALDVSTHEKATAAISVLDDAIAAVSAQRSQLGAYQNRLEHTINNLGTSSENLTAAESRIRDVDMAKEMMEFTKNNILSQAAQAMMAQANQQPQGVLQLLR